MLRVCEKLREVDAKARRLGLVRTETDYLRALLDAMADMDSLGEVELLKSLGDVNLEKGRLGKNVPRFDRALVLYRAALLRCEDAEVRESLANRCRYAVELILGRVTENPWGSVSFELHTTDRKMSSPAKVAEKFLQLDLRFTSGCKRNFVLIEYTTLMIEGIVNEDNMLETEAIKSLGDVYLRRGAETRDTTELTKATALYNTALARCEGTQGRVALIHRLLYTARVRQGMQRTGNKTSKFRQRQQQRGHLAVTPPSTDVIFTGKTEVQKFILPSDYISSQTPKHVPDFRSYEKYLIAGDRALTDGKLHLAERKFAAALKLIHDRNQPDRHKENDCLCRLGDVYLQRGKTTKAGRNFTRAAALYNAAMARTDKNKHSVTERLREIEQCLLRYTANVDSKSIESDQAIRHQKRLEDIRSSAKLQLEAIGQQHDPYQYDEDDPCMKTVEAERAEAVKALFKNIAKDRQTFIRELVDECIETLGPPPCRYAFIGLGSQATELVTPYSDLEFAILIEDGKDNDDTRRYFLNLTHYLHLKVINLGETILPAMAIPSLNDFQSEDPEKYWFFDSVTPRGFAFDGFMPWACKTPFGRDKTKMKSQVSLIQTPANMAQFQHLDISLSEGYHLSDILRRYVFLAGEEELVKGYEEKISEIITDGLLSNFQSRLSAMQILYENREQFFNLEPTGQLLNVKKDIYRFPGIAIELLALCCQITQSSAWDVIDRLKEMEKIQEENATHLTVLTSISAELRLRTYMANGGQKDDLSPLAQMKYQSESHEVSDSVLRSVFYIPDTKVLFRYYCRAIPLKKCIPSTVHASTSLEVESLRLFKTSTLFDGSNECMGRIADNLLLSDASKHHWEAALSEVGNDAIKRAKIYSKLGQHFTSLGDITKAKDYLEQSLKIFQCFYGENVAHLRIAEALSNLGVSWSALGDQKKAISYHEQSLMMDKMIHGANTAHLAIATSLLNLGSSWSKLGDQKKAISYLEQSLMMRKTIYGHNTAHLDIAISLNNLGSSWSRLGDKKEAISYHEQSLTMMKTLYGNNTAHPDIAKSLHNLGSSCSKLGDHKKAISYFEQSLTMRKTIHGDNTAHPSIAMSLHNLGSSWSALGDQKKAISYFEQSLTISKTIYGDNIAHPDIATSFYNLGSCWSELGDQKRAISYYEQSLTMRKTIYGEDAAHPDIAHSLHSLGLSWGELGDQTKANSYFEQSLSMIKTIYGNNTEHPEIAKSLLNLGFSWSKLGDQTKAISYYEQSLTMMRIIYGHNTEHPDIAGSFQNLGLSWDKLGNQKKAISYFEQSLRMRKTIYGENTAHLDIAKSLYNLGLSWDKFRHPEKAIHYFEQSLTIMKIIFGQNVENPKIAELLCNLGISWGSLGDQKKANSYFEQSLTMEKTIYGDNTAHLDVANTLHNLGSSWRLLGDQQKAISYYEESLTMMRIIYGDSTAHIDISRSLHSLGLAWGELGDETKAISFFEQSLTVRKTIHENNAEHPDLVQTLNNLALFWDKLGNHEKAISYYEQSLPIMKIIYGDNAEHPKIAELLCSLGSSWGSLGDHKKAISYYEQSLAMMKIIFGDKTEHLEIAELLYNMGCSWSSLGDQKKASGYFEQSLTMRKTIYGDNTARLDIANTIHNLGTSRGLLGDQRKGISHYEQSLAMRRIIYGDNTAHPEIAGSLYHLGASWCKLGDLRKGISYFEQSLAMTKTIYGDNAEHPKVAEILYNIGFARSMEQSGR